MGDKELKFNRKIPLYGVVGFGIGFALSLWLALLKTEGEPNVIGQVIGGALQNIIPGCSDMSFALCILFAVGGAVGGASVGLTLAYLKKEEEK